MILHDFMATRKFPASKQYKIYLFFFFFFESGDEECKVRTRTPDLEMHLLSYYRWANTWVLQNLSHWFMQYYCLLVGPSKEFCNSLGLVCFVLFFLNEPTCAMGPLVYNMGFYGDRGSFLGEAKLIL